jgi:hypothetical protein
MNRSCIECFLIEPTDQYWRMLRRYVSDLNRPCPACPDAYHNAEVLIDTVEAESHPTTSDDPAMRDDPRWPTTCDRCDYTFVETDERQVSHDQQYVDRRTGLVYTIHGSHHVPRPHVPIEAAPDGAIWRATWYEDMPEFTGSDGHSYIVRTPGGDWAVDGPSTDHASRPQPKRTGGGWQRHGSPPFLTVRPSILLGKKPDGSWTYHGFLTNGFLEEC